MKYFALLTLTLFSAASASAAALAGTFNMTGIVTVTPTTITWTTDAPGGAAEKFTLNLGTGSFSVENGQNGIMDLNEVTQPVGATFADALFIQFDVVPLSADLDINFINAGIYGSADCFNPNPAVGQQCTLPGSPFNFVNNPGGSAAPIQGTATWVFSGETSDHLSIWTANFTSHFNVPYQTVLAGFIAGGPGASATNSYAAISTVVVTPIGTVPEPGTLALMGAGLVLLSAGIRRRFVK